MKIEMNMVKAENVEQEKYSNQSQSSTSKKNLDVIDMDEDAPPDRTTSLKTINQYSGLSIMI